MDADGHAYSENVRTVIINKHGGKIATTRHLTMGTEILIENHAMGLAAKASVAWLGEKPSAGDLHHVGLQLLEAQNIWGIAFPPDDWVAEVGGEELAKPRPVPTPGTRTQQVAGRPHLHWPATRSPIGSCTSCRQSPTPVPWIFRTG